MSPGARRLSFALAALVLAIVFAALGVWQLERRVWKLRLIAAVDARAAAPAAPAPGPADWPRLDAARDAYRHVQLRGVFIARRPTLVQAVTRLGPGFWVMSPLRTAKGFTVLVNRGFVPPEAVAQLAAPTGATTVAGLLRLSEPRGGFLRRNRPALERWYSRDVAAIASADRLAEPVAPYFVDAEARPGPEPWPAGGLTVIRFPNSHLVYALTWFALAALCFWGCRLVLSG